MIELTIDSIRVTFENHQRVLFLSEINKKSWFLKKDKKRYLPIFIDNRNAELISMKLQGISPPRPVIHDLICSSIDALGANIDHVEIAELKDDCFYAKTVLNCDGVLVEIDCRPSDAIALAVRAEARIMADEDVMNKASVILTEK